MLIATDAMTRGMDVEGIRNVINYDMPPYVKTYIHRAGRTARAGLSGSCFTMLRKHEVMIDILLMNVLFPIICYQIVLGRPLLVFTKEICHLLPFPPALYSGFRCMFNILNILFASVFSKHINRFCS